MAKLTPSIAGPTEVNAHEYRLNVFHQSKLQTSHDNVFQSTLKLCWVFLSLIKLGCKEKHAG